nr:MAG TPA: DNA POLYMERASE [Caudoviricetes sp.]
MLIFDIETDGLLRDVSKVYCMTVYNSETQKTTAYTPDNIGAGIFDLYHEWTNDTYICGHNIIGYDIPALCKCTSDRLLITEDMKRRCVDTLVLSRLYYPNIIDIDMNLVRKGILPTKLMGRHSLEAWGYRLGVLKGEYGKQSNAWDKYTDEMLTYNMQDVVVDKALWEHLMKQDYDMRAVTLEHRVAWICSEIEQNGFPFDKAKAEDLEKELRIKDAEVQDKLITAIPELPDKDFIPKRDNSAKGYKKGVPVKRTKPFNPSSRQQIEYVLRVMYGYSPREEKLYDKGTTGRARLKIDEETFKFILSDDNAPEEVKELARLFADSLLYTKRLGQLADGKHAWLKEYDKRDGRIHGQVIGNGTVSGRASHNNPNLAQVPNSSSPYGKECRALFHPGEGRVQAGIDASGLELRCLAHYLYPYDGGAYAKEILEGDIHTKNQQAAGLETRNQAKTFIYGYLYGAGAAKIGEIVGGGESEGKALKAKFLKNLPAVKDLQNAIQNALVEKGDRGQILRWKRKYLKGLDGRLLHVRSLHSALNLLLQSAGAIVCKVWLMYLDKRLVKRGLQKGINKDYAILGWIHDECQYSCKDEATANIIIEEAQEAMCDAQHKLGFKCQLDTEGKTGHNWQECH